MDKGQVVSGRFGEVKVRQKAGQELELGELLIAETPNDKVLMQVYDLKYGSQISDQNLELISGMQLEEDADLDFMDPELRNYSLAYLKSLVTISGKDATPSKSLPKFFSTVRDVRKDDLKFLTEPKNPLYLGSLRSGSKTVDVPIYLDGHKVFSHHILITGTTGKGKSNLMSNLLWDATKRKYCSLLVLDPHDEYYGRNGLGLKDHEEDVAYYTSQKVPPGGLTLKINLGILRPNHFQFMGWTSAQVDAMYAFHKEYADEWVEAVLTGQPIQNVHEGTIAVLKRKLSNILDIRVGDETISCDGIFDSSSGKTTVKEIVEKIEKGTTVVVDTSNFSGQVELLIGSLISTELLSRYKYYKRTGELADKPVVSIVLEEAPRVLGKEVLEKGNNIFSTIAREGRKFNVGITAITQMPSLIPRQILANMNTKIILGTEMNTERQAIIESASQDLSSDNRNIASLDKGEAVVSSNFGKFALPLQIPLFSEFAKKKDKDTKKSFEGMQ